MRENWIVISMISTRGIMKKAIVIGATSGIGRETAVRLVEESEILINRVMVRI